MNVVDEPRLHPFGVPIRILVAGTDLLTDALASALQVYGFTTRHVLLRQPDIGRGVQWRPHLVLIDTRSIDASSGPTLVCELLRSDLKVCVIDTETNRDRVEMWRAAGASGLIDRGKPFEEVFRTINRILHIPSLPRGARTPSPSSPPLTRGDKAQWQSPQLRPFDILTEREQVVLAELIEGNCAEEIAKAAFVSISTVRSQIKAILHKLGVNSQLAAVALARRAEWSLDRMPEASHKSCTGRRPRAS